MDAKYALTILWFFFACLTFGCLVGGNEPKKWHTPTKSEAFKVWLMSIFWFITYLWWALSSINWSWFVGDKK